jgi:LCP family protein required for cell wall assembly
MSDKIFNDDDFEEDDNENINQQDYKKVKKKTKEKRKNKPWLIALAIEVVLIVGLAIFFVNHYVNNVTEKMDIVKLENVKVNEDLPEETIQKMTGYTTIALFGVDSRDTEISETGSRSDAIIICSINNDTQQVKLVSVYRDTYLELENSSKSYEKVTHAYAYGGAEEAINTLNKNLDLNITAYITVNFAALTEAIDALGGLDIELKSSELNKLNECIDEQMRVNGIQSTYVYDTGVVHLDGVQSTAYARIRSTDQGDITRAWRQRKVISLMIEKAKSAGLSKINDCINVVADDVSTSLTKSDMLNLAKNCLNYDLSSSVGFPFTWATTTLSSKGSIVVACDLETNVTVLHRYLYDDEDYEPSQTVKSISAVVSSDTGYGNQIDLDTYTVENDEESICD